MKDVLVSIIVTTQNSSKTLTKCLLSIQNQTYTNIELIVVDNYSKDGTPDIAKQYTKYVFQKGSERSAQRNFGAKKSKGAFMLFLDSDMFLSNKVIEECVKKMTTKLIVGLNIPEQISGDSFWAKVRNFERSFYNGTLIDAVRFVRKEEFDKTGGFDETLFAGEDWDLDKRIRMLGKTSLITEPLYHDESAFSLSSYIRKKAYYSTNLDAYKSKWHDNEVKKQFSIWYRYVGVFIEKGKWQHLVTHPQYMIPMLFLRFIVGLTYLIHKK